MGNPRTTDRGSCFDCDANGGPEPTVPGGVKCLRPKDSGKEVSRWPEAGCVWWVPAKPEPDDESRIGLPSTLSPAHVTAIITENEYRAALREASALVDLDPAPDTEAGRRLDALAEMVEAYEAKHYPLDSPAL
jgi:hypothetical protein